MDGHDRYRLLDELRGVAALGVLVFHIGTRGGGPALLPNGYLAVDFFFMLSGFVIAEAYEQRLVAGMSFGAFAVRRLIRMMPMAMLGAFVGGAYLLARYFAAPARSDALVEVLAGNVLNFFVLPKLWHGGAMGWELFPANGPLWSLFFEIAINLLWAAFLAGRSTRVLARLVAASALALVCCGVYFGTLHLGWGAGSLIGGAARVSFGFGTGLLLHRCRALLPVMGRRAAWVVLAALVYLMALPLVAIGWTLAVVLLCLPAVLVIAVAAGQHAVLPGGAFLGRLSYPLYATDLPLIALIALIAGMLKYVGVAQGWPMLVLVPLLLAVAYRVLVGLDEPVRAWLARRFLRQVPQGAGGAIQPERDCGESRQAADRGWESPVSGEPGIARQHAAELKTGSELNLSLREETATAGYAPGGLQVV